MYTVISTYAGGGSACGKGWGTGALNCHPKATNKEQNILTGSIITNAVMG